MKSFVLLALSLGLISRAFAAAPSATTDLNGAWGATAHDVEQVLLIVDGYWSYAIYDAEGKQFHRTFGGPFELTNGVATGTVQFDSAEPERVGEEVSVQVDLDGDELRLRTDDGGEERWSRIDDGKGPLAGVWRISGRQRDGEMQSMPLRARRTLKLLTGSRFQWVAMNIETGEFSGTGGGTYTFENGTYTEHIEYFSRDGSRVGAVLPFEGEVRKGEWHHRGVSSRGQPIYEIWTKLDPAAATPRSAGADAPQ